MNIGIVGARKYQDRQSVLDLVNSLPADSVIVTSGCAGVCTWVREKAEKRNMEVVVFSPDLQNIRAWFEVPKRYYQRNKELVEACDYLYAFISREDGFVGGTRFEVKYALKLKKPVQLHWENGISETFYQYPLPFMESQHTFFLAWQDFFCKTNLETGG
ncbi:MAG: hypothetical protein ABIN18_26655 [Pseudomonadota bacterium]